MRVLYLDIDSLRPDHLGCYGYHRKTSPNIDRIASEGTRFTNCYVSDAPCLPSRTALWSGRFGFHTGVVDHGGIASQPFIEGAERTFRDLFSKSSWMIALQQIGYHTASISSFAARHSAWHWYAGYDEYINPGVRGLETADQVAPIAQRWLEEKGASDHWFLHVNLWDAHTPYRTPPEYGNPFADDPLPAHITEEYWQKAWDGYGPHSPQEVNDFAENEIIERLYPYVPQQLDSMEKVRWWLDGYDRGIHYADHYIGQIIATLQEIGVYEETVIMIGADHGENQGELNVWGDHHTADSITCRVPLIVRWPQQAARVDHALHYHFDWAATLIELLGGEVPKIWDGVSFADAFREASEDGRDFLVTSQGAWSCQRGVRYNHDGHAYLFLRTYHDGYKMLDDVMLFDLTTDPHEQVNIADEQPQRVQQGMAYLENWYTQMIRTGQHATDPLATVLRAGGAYHTRGELPAYLERLRATGRAHHAQTLAQKHPDEV